MQIGQMGAKPAVFLELDSSPSSNTMLLLEELGDCQRFKSSCVVIFFSKIYYIRNEYAAKMYVDRCST